jgi:hypothetical protein
MGGMSSLWRALLTGPTVDDLFTVAQRLADTVTVELADAA